MNICTHYGFGDYVICFGLIKYLSETSDVTLFVRNHQSELHISNIKRLYSSIGNVTINTNAPELYPDVIYIGWEKLFKAVEDGYNLTATEFFYNQMDVPINCLWDKFSFDRDIEKEKRIYNDLNLGDYIFVHDDPSRGYAIKNMFIKGKVFRLMNHPGISILDILYLVEKAKEVHVSNTGLLSFIDQMNIKHDNLNYHRYTRTLSFEQPLLRLKWNIIDE